MSEVAEKVEQAAEKVAAEVKADVKEVVEAAKAEVAKNTIEITDAEKLILRELENQFLKAQLEIQRLQATTQELQKRFPAYIQELTKKYVKETQEFAFDAARLIFVRKAAQGAQAPAAPAAK